MSAFATDEESGPETKGVPGKDPRKGPRKGSRRGRRKELRVEPLFAFDDATLSALAKERQTPFFAYRAGLAGERLAELRAVLPPRARVAYAVKANPHPQLLCELAAAGASFDCASLGELDRVAALGVSASRVFFAGPGKRQAEIAAAVGRGVRIQAEGVEDLARVESTAAQLSLDRVDVNLRVQPALVTESGPEILGGSGPSAFGVDEEDLDMLLTAARGLERVRISGLHGFAASNERSASRLLEIWDRMHWIGRRLQRWLRAPLQQIDLGGGLGVPYADGDAALDLDLLSEGTAALLERHHWFRGELIVEPGRFLAAPIGVYVARVVRTKHSRGRDFAILEGGINHLLRPLLTGEAFPVRVLGKSGPTREVTLAGPLCTGLDRLGRVRLPELVPDDLVVFGMTGAYGSTEAMTRFLDHPPADEIWLAE